MLNEIFPSFYDAMAKQDVLALVVGLSKDPRPIVKHVHELYNEMYVGDLRFRNMDKELMKKLQDQGKKPDDPFLFISLYGESTLELAGSWNHNEHSNMFNHFDQVYNTFKGRGPVFFPSKMYMFDKPNEDINGEIEQREQERHTEMPECAMVIMRLEATMIKNVLSLCRKISEQQTVTDFLMDGVKGEFLSEAEAPNLRRHIQSVSVTNSQLSAPFMRNILHQLLDCSALKTLDLQGTDLREIESDLDKLLEKLSGHCLKQKRELRLIVTMSMVSTKFCKKWAYRCEETGIGFYYKAIKEENFDDMSMDIINWSSQELENKHGGLGETFNCQYPSLKKTTKNFTANLHQKE